MNTAELNSLVDNNPSVKAADQSVVAAKAALDAAVIERDRTYAEWQQRIIQYNNSNFLNRKGALDRMNAGNNYYESKVSLFNTAQSAYKSALSIASQTREQITAGIVAQQNAAAAAEIEASKVAAAREAAKAEVSKAEAAKSNVSTSANIVEQVKQSSVLEYAKENRQKIVILGGAVLLMVAIIGVIVYLKNKGKN